jgi:hypothetical protein
MVGLVALVAASFAVHAAEPEAVSPQPSTAPQGNPWWEDFPTIVQTGDGALAAKIHALASMCGAADDPCWGIFAQRTRFASSRDRVKELHSRGLKALTWLEGFGTTGAYIVQLRRNDDGTWIKQPTDPTLARVFRNAWGWKGFDGTGVVRWVGVFNYYDPQDFVEPYTHLHPRYGAPPMTYPDGRIATGFLGEADQPWTHRVYDATCAKDVMGRVHFENAELNRATAGSEGAAAALSETPDPGYTPEEWAQRRRQELAQLRTVRFSVGKDSACPLWDGYLRASIRQALDLGIDGVWVDNFSPWDSLGSCPLKKGFGEWAVAGFRGHLAKMFSPAELGAMGVGDASRFDVRAYLIAQCQAWGGSPENFRDKAWGDARWLDDPVWRAYLIYKRQTGTAALARYYRTIKREAAAMGKPDFLVMGNDIPMFGLGWPRGTLDMVSTELSWGWSLTGGARGLMPPPWGSYVPVYKLAREHAASRFVNIWMYGPKDQLGKPNIARVLYYQGLANHTFPMPHYKANRRDVGNEATDEEFFAFVRRAAPTFGARVPAQDVGLYFSSSSELMTLTPKGFVDFGNQTHAFSFWGWGTAMTWNHVCWRAIPEWKLTDDALAGLRVLVVPAAEVFPAADVPLLEHWVKRGGTLVLAGRCGSRLGERGNFASCPPGTGLSVLAGTSASRQLGKGRVVTVADDPGGAFYKAESERPQLLARFAKILAEAASPGIGLLQAPDVPWQVGITPYVAPHRLFVDVNNTSIDLRTDTITPAPPIRFKVALPADLRGKQLHAEVLSPGAVPDVELTSLEDGRVTVSLESVEVYASVLIEPVVQSKPSRR